ncbi:MAG TPA: class I SAM-dependent methyltransferase [Verrucomicrobiae bacterium]|nr:class I SAM-dependent methyltransferase [Verrucomicrobiae bacterium]
MDHCAISVNAFDKLADLYRQKYMDLTQYDGSYRKFCELLRPGRARVLDAACGPGNVSRYLMAQRPDLDLLGVDLAPRMVELAREAVPNAKFAVHDCRHLAELQRRFDGIICAFGLPYLLPEEATDFVGQAANVLHPGGILYLSTMLGTSEESGLQRSSTGDEFYVNYHGEDQIIRAVENSGLKLVERRLMDSPSAASKRTTDLIVIANK